MLHDVIFGAPKNLLRLLSSAQSANGVTAQVAANGLVTLSGTATADTTITLPVNAVTLGTGAYTASLTAKNGYATGTVTAAITQTAQATQVITNGNFATSSNNLATGFAVGHGVAVSCTNNTQTFRATAQSGQLDMYNYPYLSGHKYFIRCYVQATSTSVVLYAQNGTAVTHPGDGKYEPLSCIVTVTVSNFYAVIVDRRTSGWDNISVQSFMAIDMGTDASNPLYNLAAAQMAALFPSYFDGAKAVTLPNPFATVSVGSPATFTAQSGQSIPSVQISIPAGTACSQYAVGLQVESGSTATGWVSPGTQGVIFYPAEGETGTITNTGNVDAYPIITITGACANPSVTNDTTGESISVNLALGSTDTLVIDCRPATRGCYLNGTLAFGIKQELGWIHCPPGDNVLTFARNGYDTKRHCTVSLQGRYL
ncbi:phage distal tail protein [Ethanoligenens harbinense]|uniref:Siphovirus-type tail component C-terminal domain-containing protein n=1 Tax=Ethanoligenens harbinense (strain DSM 18485 / JCM 12961 / CGMCC 1.5033 / YUAN-3) TaxID=663278 RepID=E6U8P8_ETHHY|nr:phage tail domain-containing protein [Ethanoligenens harbinense]ADU27133.1 hypothetical protein Ethha_1598 [Ethanoligenens harbinense YUAN-3]AVQ96209.1 phage tail protein [Ethanoligenens harbinense YUAN-3]AYF38869.1 phage tail protein [Ethanoligenens harbinense]AYF41619.1 phage tail protein [Ethanoligenens harbinense]QCN92449.1 phage tail protein [Ethanoligenens harbinense]